MFNPFYGLENTSQSTKYIRDFQQHLYEHPQYFSIGDLLIILDHDFLA